LKLPLADAFKTCNMTNTSLVRNSALNVVDVVFIPDAPVNYTQAQKEEHRKENLAMVVRAEHRIPFAVPFEIVHQPLRIIEPKTKDSVIFSCQNCNAPFQNESILDRHSEKCVHTYDCYHCDRKFSIWWDSIMHQMLNYSFPFYKKPKYEYRCAAATVIQK
jgi:hypothetical protein